LNAPRSAVFKFKGPIKIAGGATITVTLDQSHGSNHTIGRPRISFGTASESESESPLAQRRSDALQKKFSEWLEQQRTRLVQWTALRPSEAVSNLPLLTVQQDLSVFASGDISKADTYDLKFTGLPAGITALRLEALPDDRLPAHGPGLTYYE